MAVQYNGGEDTWIVFLNAVEIAVGLEHVRPPGVDGSLLVGQLEECSSQRVLMFDDQRG